MTKRSGLEETQRLELICETIRYCQRIRDGGGPAAVWTKALREAVHFIWELRRGNKTVAARYRSRASKGLFFGSHHIVYEHVIPLKVVHKALMDLVDPDPTEVKAILDRMLITCIVTKEEDQKLGRGMPSDWDGIASFVRYDLAGIEVEDNPDWAFATKD